MSQYRHVVEIGAGDSRSSQGLALAPHADLVTLYEPNCILWLDLIAPAMELGNVVTHEAAVYDPSAQVPLYHLGYASFLQGAPSFLATSVERGYEQWWEPLAREVRIKCVGDAIPGDTDYLILTANGAESLILQQMVARPKEIRTKHYCHNPAQWEETHRIWTWLFKEGYNGSTIESNQYGTFLSVHWRRGVS